MEPKKDTGLKVAEDVAEQEFEDFIKAMDLDMDTAGMDAEDLTGFHKLKRRVIKAITRGNLVFNDEWEAVYTPTHKRTTHKDPITFHERAGSSIVAMDGKKKGHDAAKMYAVLGSMCEVPPKTFSNMVGEDIKVCEALFSLLME